MILLSIIVSRFYLVSGAVGIAPINSHSNCTLLLLLAPRLYRWNRTTTSRLLFVFIASSLWLCYLAIVLRTTSVYFRYLTSCLTAVPILIPSRGEWSVSRDLLNFSAEMDYRFHFNQGSFASLNTITQIYI